MRVRAALSRLQAQRQRLGATAVACLADQPEGDLALLQAGLEHHDAGAVAQAVLAAGAFAGERLADRVEVVVIVRQLGHVHKAVALRLVQFDEQTEAGDASDHAVELAAPVLLPPRSAVAVVDFALGLFRAAGVRGVSRSLYWRRERSRVSDVGMGAKCW